MVKRLAEQRLRQVERQIAAIDAALRALCQADPDLKARLDILVSIPAIGEATALAMLIEMPELGTIENKCVARLQASPRSHATLGNIAAIALSALDAHTSAKPFTCQLWAQSASTPT